jgi:hypothetical protein
MRRDKIIETEETEEKNKKWEKPQARKLSVGLFLGSALRIIFGIIKGILKIVYKLLVFFGLWIPVVYVIFGAILHRFTGFNPFGFSLYGTIYLSGFVAAVVCCIIIAVKNAVVKPARSVYEGYKNPIWKKPPAAQKDEEEAELKARWESYKDAKRLSPPPIDDFSPSRRPSVPPPKRPEYLFDDRDFFPEEQRAEKTEQALSYYDWLPRNGGLEKSPIQSPPRVFSAPVYETPEVYFSKLEPNLLVHEYGDRFELFTVSKDGGRRQVKIEYK